MKRALIVTATLAAACFGVFRVVTGCAAVEKADPVAVYPTPEGYCPLQCALGCCPYGSAYDGWTCPSPVDKTGAICNFNGPVTPTPGGGFALKLDAGTDAAR